MLKTTKDYPLGSKVKVTPSRYGWDHDEGEYYVVGYIAPTDLKLAKHPDDSWALIVHLQRIEGSGY